MMLSALRVGSSNNNSSNYSSSNSNYNKTEATVTATDATTKRKQQQQNGSTDQQQQQQQQNGTNNTSNSSGSISSLAKEETPASSLSASWVPAVSRLSLGVNLTNIFAIHYLRGRAMDQPIEFSHIHVVLYTLFAWTAAVLVSVVVHCMISPYVVIFDSLLSSLSRCLLGPRR
ncbi:unnamed protein product [Polarella glacialis]|uniref:Uncharacterized protein n=1 Tax=Polarella glacialis TaxID=89957 RepID=A0A813JYX5_POLGL|nr:unnamed protein product [Polarella glacialis]